MEDKEIFIKAMLKVSSPKKSLALIEGWYNDICYEGGLYDEIFSHDFAKAFWGERRIEIGRHRLNEEGKVDKPYPEWAINMYAWQWHLQQMVLEKEPLKYLEKFL